jgi:hypothetical protein
MNMLYRILLIGLIKVYLLSKVFNERCLAIFNVILVSVHILICPLVLCLLIFFKQF